MPTASLKIEPQAARPIINLSKMRSHGHSVVEDTQTSPAQEPEDNDYLTIRAIKTETQEQRGGLLDLRNRVPAVVSKAQGQFAHIRCQLAQKTVEIEVPMSLVPEGLRAFGKTVWVGIDTQADLKRLIVEERRAAPERREAVPEDIQEWLKN